MILLVAVFSFCFFSFALFIYFTCFRMIPISAVPVYNEIKKGKKRKKK